MTALTRGPYQLLPPLSEDEYAALRDDIRGAGVRVPIDVDEDGNILDGHHRKAIAEELGVECPERVVRDLPEFAKVDYALTVNLTRRHLTTDQKKALVKASLKRDPSLSNRDHARRCAVGHPFVAGLREAMEAAGQIAPREGRTGRDGKEYPARRPPQVESDSTSPTEGNQDNAFSEAAAADRVDSATASPGVPANTPGPAETSTAGATGAGSAPAPVADTPKPATWTKEEREAHEEEVQLRKDRESAWAYAPRLVTNVRAAVLTIVTGYRLGERDLVTAEQIAECRAVLDMLEKEVLADAQR